MRLKSLRLAGFKSFANPTTFSFTHNITAIVGPNGCGKSNVIDAIRWVLGETSAKQLRGGAMSDVIFAGTQDKAGKSLASVELTFEHTQDEQTGIRHELNLYHELSVRRQVNKNGKSDYFVNGTRCRRRDVVDIFLGTGLGARSYAVIEQGMIGRIVDSSPMQLREFIEEGAGVSRYQARRIETQKKLSKAEENLSRLNDLKSELEKQHKTLTRQAKTAQQYQDIKNQLAGLEQDMAIHQLLVAKQAEVQQQKHHEQLTQVVQNAQNELTTHSGKLSKLANRIAEHQWLKDDARDKLHDEQLKLQQAEHGLSQLNGRLSQMSDKQASIAEQVDYNHNQINHLHEKQQHEQTQLEAILPQLDTLKTRKQQLQTQLEPLNQQWQSIHGQREQLNQQKQQLEKQQALTEQTQQRVQQDAQKWQKSQHAWQQAWTALSEVADSKSLEDTLNEHKRTLTGLINQSDDVQTQKEDEQAQFVRLKSLVNDAQTALQTLEKRQATLNSEYNTLHALVFPKKSTSQPALPGSQQNFQNSSQNNSQQASQQSSQQANIALPVLSDGIELTKKGLEYADVLDAWLAIWLDAMVNDKQGKGLDSTAQNLQTNILLANLLSQQQPKPEHTAVFNTHTSHTQELQYKQIDTDTWLSDINNNSSNNSRQQNCQLIALPELIKTPKLALWQTGYLCIVDDNSDANINDVDGNLIDSINKHMTIGHFVLTNTGWLVGQFGQVHLSKLGKQNGDSHFLRQREAQRQRLATLEDELTEVEDQIEAQQKTLKKQQAQHDDLQIVLEELSAQANNIQTRIHTTRQSMTEMSAKYERQQADSKRLSAEEARLKEEKTTIDAAKKEADNTLQSLNQQLPALYQQLQQVEEERSQIRHQRTEADNQSREVDGQLQALQLQQGQLTISIQHLTGQAVNLEKQLQRLQQEHDGLDSKLDKLQQQSPALEKNVKQHQQLCHEAQVTLDEYQGQLDELQKQHATEQTVYEKQQATLATQQAELANVSTQLAVAKERLSDASQRVDALATAMHTSHSLATQKSVAKNTDSVDMEAGTEVNNIEASNNTEANTAANVSANNTKTNTKTTSAALQSHAQIHINGNNNTPPNKHSSKTLLADFMAGNSSFKVDEQTQQQRQLDYQALQIKIGRMGAVNLVAVEELAQVNERLTPLTEQIDDILASIDKLTDAIKTIDEKTKALFTQMLESVNQEMSRLFAKVFGGGQASLSLIDEENLPKADRWRAGLELMAQPKGKKNARLAVLSGGEKTLTALSLIFAIFKQHPAPFCVLDEVDAPLDDANVGRFTGLIQELASELQFVFISHNKLSMQIADELKGITMPQAGISTLVSVSLDEAEQYLEPAV